MEAGGRSSESTEVWLANLLGQSRIEMDDKREDRGKAFRFSNLLNVFVLSLTEIACASSRLVEEGRLSNCN